MFKPYLIAIILGILISCSEKEPELEKIGHESIVLSCLYKENAEFIIESENEYIQMATQIYNEGFGFGNDCVDTSHAPFSFNDFVLMGRYTKTDMNDQLSINVYRNNSLKRIIYKVEIDKVPGPEDNGGFGIIYSSGMNWIKIPKPSDEYEIIIEYSEY